MYKSQELSTVDQEFNDLTKHFDLDDWKTLRTESYWWVETSDETIRPRTTYEKLDLIRHYVNKGITK
jgi:hypothetical protein|tara:strand:- start:4096 stop:4296 length:201 start_codon:yes stop_codon:yes gene_type:complete